MDVTKAERRSRRSLRRSLPRPAWLPAACLALAQGAAAAQPLPAELDPTDLAYPTVSTPTRLPQPVSDAPASVTVITAEMLQRHGIASIPEALRLVPGMAVSQAAGNDYRINYHGTDTILPRRLNVLIDGVSAYPAMVSAVSWTQLPVVLEDVDRIEVIRAPESAAYGPNSMSAVVNILTKHPRDVERAVGFVSVDSRGTREATARLAGTFGPSSVRLTASTERGKGYDEVRVGVGQDGWRTHRLNVRAQSDLGDRSSLDLHASLVDGVRETAQAGPLQVSSADERRQDTQVSFDWTKPLSAHHQLKVSGFTSHSRLRQDWTACWPQIAFVPALYELFQLNPGYVVRTANTLLRGGGPITLPTSPREQQLVAETLLAAFSMTPSFASPACGLLNQDIDSSRTQLEVQDTLVVSDRLRLVGGLGVRYQHADSETFFNGRASNNMRWAFVHAEYRPMQGMTVNAGGYAESNSVSDDTFSPRLAVNYQLSPGQTLRAAISRGTRSPDLFEQRGFWSYTFRGLQPAVLGMRTARAFPATQATGQMRSERIVSRELGYLLTQRQAGLTLDIKLFDDHLTHVIADYTTAENPYSITQNDDEEVRLRGAEAQLQWDFAQRWSALLSYARLINQDASHPAQRLQYSHHSGAVGLSYTPSPRWRAALTHYGASGNGFQESRYSRTDLAVSHLLRTAGGGSSTLSLIISYLDTREVQTTLGSMAAYTARYNDPLSVRATWRAGF